MKNNITPWDISIESRKAEIENAKKQNKKVALMLYSTDDLGSSFRYRSYNIYKATKNSKKWQLVYFFTDELPSLIDLLPKADLFIFGRITKWSSQYDEIAYQAHRQGLKVLLDLDDCVCGASHIKEMFNIVSPDTVDQEYWINTSAHIELISQLADGFIVTNDYLGKILSETHDDKPYKVIKNSLNDEQINYSNELLLEKQNKRGGLFTIGYFSGSHTHAVDFGVVYPELIAILENHQDIRLSIVGMLELPNSASKFLKNGQIKYHQAVDFLSLQKYISEVDVNIAPLDNNIFANCKSELKFFEAALVKTPTIASPTFAFKNAIKNRTTGILCQPGEWTDAIIKLYDDRLFADMLAENAYNFIKKTYYPDAIIEQIESTYDYFFEK